MINKNQNNNDIGVLIWISLLTLMVLTIIIIGGLTRLTESGLSMVDWRPLMGTIPPLSSDAWLKVFEQYKLSPEFKIVNSKMQLEDFKFIFWWEWTHRFFARLIGIVFLFPFIYFIINKKLSKKIVMAMALIFLLGLIQAVVGWWMVKSGLTEDPYVSTYRLSFHFTNALIIFIILYWLSLLLFFKSQEKHQRKKLIINLFHFGLILIFLTIISGTFMAGTDAGKSFNTFPLMNEKFLPDDYYLDYLGWKNSFENIVAINFNHRWLAIFTFIFIFILIIYLVNDKKEKYHNYSLNLVLLTLSLQILLGIITLIYEVPIILASLHQTNAILLLASMLFAYNRLIYK